MLLANYASRSVPSAVAAPQGRAFPVHQTQALGMDRAVPHRACTPRAMTHVSTISTRRQAQLNQTVTAQALGSTWRQEYPPQANAPQAFTQAREQFTAEKLLDFTMRTRLPSLTSWCTRLLAQVPQPVASGALPHQLDLEACVHWVRELHAWYSTWTAVSTSTESLLELLPPGTNKVCRIILSCLMFLHTGQPYS